jgi:hypothetical protein
MMLEETEIEQNDEQVIRTVFNKTVLRMLTVAIKCALDKPHEEINIAEYLRQYQKDAAHYLHRSNELSLSRQQKVLLRLLAMSPRLFCIVYRAKEGKNRK